MLRSTFLTLISLIAFQVGIARAGHAQDLSLRVLPVPPTATSTKLTLEAHHRELAAAKRLIRRGRIGVSVSAVAVYAGTAMFFAGALRTGFCLGETSPCGGTLERVLMGVGAVTMLGGVAGLGVSTVRLRQGRKDKRRLQGLNREMRVSLKSTGASFRLRF